MRNIFVKTLIFCSIFYISSSSKRNDGLISAFSSIISELFIHPQIPFDVITYKSTSSLTSDLIDGIGSHLSEKIFSTLKPLQLTQSAIIFTDNESDLFEFLNKTELKNDVAKPLRFLIHSSGKFEIQNLKIPPTSSDQGHIGHFSYFITETLKEVHIKTLEWFTAQACHVQQTILINSFDKKKLKWIKDLKIPQKFLNFHNCQMVTYSRIYFYPSLEILLLLQGVIGAYHVRPKKLALQPFDTEIANIIAKKGNFTNKIVSEVFEVDHSVDIFYLSRSLVLNDECHVGSIISQDYETFATSLPESYTSYEKMQLPFDTPTWICLLTTMLLAFIAISIINKTPEWVQDIFYGKGLRNAGINFIGFFFGIGQTKLPENNFARILLTAHVLFFMIFNTAYHGVFFKVMTTDVKKPLPQSLEDLYKMNFSINCIVSRGNKRVGIRSELGHFFDENPTAIEIDVGDMLFFYASLAEPSGKKGFFYSGRAHEADKSLWIKPPIMMSHYRYRMLHYGIGLMRNNFIYEVTEDTMSKLVQAGIPKYFESYINQVILKPYPEPDKSPRVFALKDLEFGFVIYLVCCAISLTGFILELLYFNFKKILGMLTILRFSTQRLFPPVLGE